MTGATVKGANATAVVLADADPLTLTGAAVTVGGSVDFNAAAGFTIASDDPTPNTLITAATIGSTLYDVASISVGTTQGANDALLIVDGALELISSNRAQLGAVQNRFLTTIENLQTNSENLSASRSRIQDADFAAETANLSRTQILQQAGTAMVAQANQLPQGVLALLRQ
jgi:flagellin